MASADRFSYEWVKFHSIDKSYEKQFLGWVTPLKSADFKGKYVLDAGCGIGRNSYWALNFGAKKVIAFDYDRNTIAVAKRNLLQFKNAHAEFRSIYEMPYSQQFDITMCIGVLHHLENPHFALKNLVRSTKKEA